MRGDAAPPDRDAHSRWRRFTVAASGVTLAAAAALVLATSGGGSAPAPDAPAAVPATRPGAIEDGSAGAPANATARAEVATGGFVAFERRPLGDARPGELPVRVVLAADGRPAGGATVWFDTPRGRRADVANGGTPPPELRLAPFHRLELDGVAVTADAAGRAAVPIRTQRFAIAAAHGDCVGTVEVDGHDAVPAGGILLLLAPAPELAIAVADHDGRPVGGAPLSWYCASHELRLGLGVTDATGTRRVRDAAALLEALATVRVHWPGCDDVRGALDHDGVLRFALPPSGAIELALVDAGGGPLACRRALSCLRVMPAPVVDGHDLLWEATTGADGRCVFPHVPLQAAFVANVGERRVRFAGPTRAGERVTVTIPPPDGELVLRGRLVDATGRPIAATALRGFVTADAESPPWPDRAVLLGRGAGSGPQPGRRTFRPAAPRADFEAHTGADGAFASVVAGIGAARGVMWLHSPRRTADCRHATFVLPGNASDGTVDVGDLTVNDDGLVASAKLVDEHGRAVCGVVTNGMREREPAAPNELVLAADDGTLRVYRSRSEPSLPIAVHATAPGRVAATCELQEGQRDVRLVLRRQPTVRVEVLVDAAVAPLQDQVDADVAGHAGTYALHRHAGRDRWTWVVAAEHVDELTLSLQATEEAFARVPIAFEPDCEPAHRIDLRGRFTVHELEIVDAAGAPLAASCASVAAIDGGALAPSLTLVEDANGLCRVLSLQPTIAVFACAREHAPAHVVASGGRTRVTLQRLPPPLHIALAPATVPDGVELALRETEGLVRAMATTVRLEPRSYDPVRLEVVARVDGEVVLALPLPPIVLRPGMDPDVRIELDASQLAQLRAAARR
jgi:hypothetical protein